MAIFEKTFTGDFDELLTKVEKTVMNRSISAQLRDSADYSTTQGRCSIRVFERYSLTAAQWVSMSVTIFQIGDELYLCAITAGGNRGVFSLDESTWGEETFLDTLKDAL